MKRNEIDSDILFIALIESARDVCRVINEDFNDYLQRCLDLGSVDNWRENSGAKDE